MPPGNGNEFSSHVYIHQTVPKVLRNECKPPMNIGFLSLWDTFTH